MKPWYAVSDGDRLALSWIAAMSFFALFDNFTQSIFTHEHRNGVTYTQNKISNLDAYVIKLEKESRTYYDAKSNGSLDVVCVRKIDSENKICEKITGRDEIPTIKIDIGYSPYSEHATRRDLEFQETKNRFAKSQ